MNTKKPIISLIFLLFFLVICNPSYADFEYPSKLYALPVSELENILLDYLIKFGFDVQRSKLEMGGIRLSILRPAENWQIKLTPQSTSTTKMQAEFFNQKRNQESTIALISEYISEYIKDSNDKKKNSNQIIPPAILSKISSIVCLRTNSIKTTTQHSGLIVATEGLILSTIHDIDDFDEITVILYDGQELIGEVVKKDPRRDLALVEVKQKLELTLASFCKRFCFFCTELTTASF